MSYPTRRPTDLDREAGESFDPPNSLLTMPWVDGHTHAHTLSWADRERYALTGCRGLVTVASGYHWTPYRPVRAADVRYCWDDALARRPNVEREHFYDVGVALGVHTGVRVADPADLLAALADYCELEEVVAVGETGVTPSQHAERWPLDGQREAVREQFALAADHDLPAILHTPNQRAADGRSYRPGVGTPGFERDGALATDPVLDGENPALEATRMDVELAREAGLPESRVVASHADPNLVDYLLGETDCYASFTVGYPWLTGVDAADVADAIERYGPERVLLDTDCANVLRTDPFAVKRAVFELYRLGVETSAIRQVVYENPRELFGVGG